MGSALSGPGRSVVEASSVGSSEGGAPPDPYLSVIVTAHDRTQFLRGAVESVLGQSLPRSEFEILVVKYLPDREIDEWLGTLGPRVRQLTDPGLPRLGQKLARGIELAHGEVVCFLEDDDRYLPDKLRVVAERFRSDASLAYFRHRNLCIDSAGRPLTGPYSRIASHDLVLGPNERRDLPTVDFIRHYGAEGNSAIAARRSVLLPQLHHLVGFSTSTDWVFFVSALASSGRLVVGARPLSEYRLHQSLSQSPDQKGRQRLGEEIVRSGETIVEIARGTRAERAARFLRGRGSVNWYLIDPDAPHPSLEMFRDAAWLAWLRREPTFAIPIGWCGLRLLAPRAASSAYWGYRQRDAARQQWTTNDPADPAAGERSVP
jgi:hypothetical protein